MTRVMPFFCATARSQPSLLQHRLKPDRLCFDRTNAQKNGGRHLAATMELLRNTRMIYFTFNIDFVVDVPSIITL